MLISGHVEVKSFNQNAKARGKGTSQHRSPCAQICPHLVTTCQSCQAVPAALSSCLLLYHMHVHTTGTHTQIPVKELISIWPPSVRGTFLKSLWSRISVHSLLGLNSTSQVVFIAILSSPVQMGLRLVVSP